MARIRSIKPEFWADEIVGTLPRDVRLLFLGLISHADDDGRFRANPRLVCSEVFPYDNDADVAGWLLELEERGRIQLYEDGGQSFGWVVNFKEHQRIDKPKPSAFPAPPPRDESKKRPRQIRDASQTSLRRIGREGKGVDRKGKEGSIAPVGAVNEGEISLLTKLLVQDYAEKRHGSAYKHGGAKDTLALKAILATGATWHEVRSRWRYGLLPKKPNAQWREINTIAQLGQKWNDLDGYGDPPPEERVLARDGPEPKTTNGAAEAMEIPF